MGSVLNAGPEITIVGALPRQIGSEIDNDLKILAEQFAEKYDSVPRNLGSTSTEAVTALEAYAQIATRVPDDPDFSYKLFSPDE